MRTKSRLHEIVANKSMLTAMGDTELGLSEPPLQLEQLPAELLVLIIDHIICDATLVALASRCSEACERVLPDLSAHAVL